jgi:hypothetical protein
MDTIKDIFKVVMQILVNIQAQELQLRRHHNNNPFTLSTPFTLKHRPSYHLNHNKLDKIRGMHYINQWVTSRHMVFRSWVYNTVIPAYLHKQQQWQLPTLRLEITHTTLPTRVYHKPRLD